MKKMSTNQKENKHILNVPVALSLIKYYSKSKQDSAISSWHSH